MIQNFHKCLEYIFKPIAKLCLKHSIKIQDIVEIFKKVLVNTARENLLENKLEVSDSRINIMTGVHRQEINRIKNQVEETKIESVITKVIGQWQNDKDFTFKNKPKVLTSVGSESEFFKLVQKVNKDLNPYTILFELERIKAIEKNKNTVKLLGKEYVPLKSLESSYFLLGRDFGNFVDTIEDNLLADKNNLPQHHLQTEYDNIPKKYHTIIKNWIHKEGILFHQKVRDFLSKYDTDINKDLVDDSKNKITVSFTSFSNIKENNEK